MPTRATLLALPCAALLAAPALAQAPPADPNIQVTISVSSERDGKPDQAKSFALVCRAGEEARLNVSSRIPVPATTFNTGADKEITPVASFTYQSVGFSADLKCYGTNNGRIGIKGKVDDASLRGPIPGAPGQPVIATFTQELDVVLIPGKPLTVVRFSDTKGVVTSLAIEAKSLD
jgi:hypothetical protein